MTHGARRKRIRRQDEEDEYDYVVVARGFDALWFRHLLDEALTRAWPR